MNLEIYKLEILRRSQERIKRRKRIRNRVLALCIPLTLLATVLLITPPFMNKKDLVSEEETVADAGIYATGSIFCSFVEAQLYVDGKTVTVTDKLTVDKLFSIAAFKNADHELYIYDLSPESATEAAAEQDVIADQNNGHAILFTTAEGASQSYYLTEEEYADILEVLK